MNEATCRTCRWWQRIATSSVGECRRYPPQIVAETDVDGESTECDWPTTIEAAWCGEHEDRKPLPTVEGVVK